MDNDNHKKLKIAASIVFTGIGVAMAVASQFIASPGQSSDSWSCDKVENLHKTHCEIKAFLSPQ